MDRPCSAPAAREAARRRGAACPVRGGRGSEPAPPLRPAVAVGVGGDVAECCHLSAFGSLTAVTARRPLPHRPPNPSPTPLRPAVAVGVCGDVAKCCHLSTRGPFARRRGSRSVDRRSRAARPLRPATASDRDRGRCSKTARSRTTNRDARRAAGGEDTKPPFDDFHPSIVAAPPSPSDADLASGPKARRRPDDRRHGVLAGGGRTCRQDRRRPGGHSAALRGSSPRLCSQPPRG